MMKILTSEPGDGLKRRPPVPNVVRWTRDADGAVRRDWRPGFLTKYPARIPEGWATEGTPQEKTMRKAVEGTADDFMVRTPLATSRRRPTPTEDDYRETLRRWNGFFGAVEGSTGGFGTLPARPRRRETEEDRKAYLLDADHGLLDYLMDARWPSEARAEAAPAWNTWRAAQPWAAEADAHIAQAAAATQSPDPETTAPPPPARRPPPSRQVLRSS